MTRSGTGAQTGRKESAAGGATQDLEQPINPPLTEPTRPSARTVALVVLVAGFAVMALSLVPEPPRPPESNRGTTGLNQIGAYPDAWLTWESHPQPAEAILADTLTSTADSFVVAGGPGPLGAVLWSSSDGVDWTYSNLPTIPYGLAGRDTSILAFRGDTGWWLEADGQAWSVTREIDLPTFLRLGYDSDRAPVIANPAAMVMQAVEGELLFGTTESGFEVVIDRDVWGRPSQGLWEDFTEPRSPGPCRADTVASNNYVPIVETDDGLVALVGGGNGRSQGLWPACSPRLWGSADGSVWTMLSRDSPFGPSGYVYDLAWRNGLFIAVGGIESQPVVWSSTDAIRWQRTTPPEFFAARTKFAAIEIEAGEAGWIIAAERSDRSTYLGWVSPDGLCWTVVPSAAAGRHVSVGADRMLIAGPRGERTMWVGTLVKTENNSTPDPEPCR